MAENMKRKRFEISYDMDYKLQQFCEKYELSQSEAVQDALDLLFEQEENKLSRNSYQTQLMNMIIEKMDGLSHQFSSENQAVINRLDSVIRYNTGGNYLKEDDE